VSTRIQTFRRGCIGLATVLAASALTHAAEAQDVIDYAGRWAFDDCSSASTGLADSSFNNVPALRGSSVGCTTDAEGRTSGAVNFTVAQPGDGLPSTTVRAGANAPFRLANTVSVSAMIKPGVTPAGAIITKGFVSGGVTKKSFQLTVERGPDNVDRLHWTVWFGSPTSTVPLMIESDVAVPPSVWSRVGASYDASSGFKIFLNGALVGSNGTTVGAPLTEAPVGTSSTVWLGGSADGQNQGFLGAMDEVWFSNGSCADLSATAPVIEKELMVRNLGVVNDTTRTGGRSAWSFARLIEQMIPASPSNVQIERDTAADLAEKMFKTWNTAQSLRRSDVGARPNIMTKVLNTWPRTANGKLDLTQAPLRLLAIVNRMDIRDLSKGHAGEGRFVFGVVDPTAVAPNSDVLQFTLILEYRLPAKTPADVRTWARMFHNLGAAADGPAYNAALQAITDRFTKRGADLSRTTGSALNQLRSNEIALDAPWELRQFELVRDVAAGVSTLKPVNVTQTPELAFNDTTTLRDYILINNAAILTGKHVVAPTFLSGGVNHSPFQAGSALNSGFNVWNAPSVSSNLRFAFAVNTCSGCHSVSETGTAFTHVKPRLANAQSALSTFLTGGTRNDPVTSVPRTFNDLARRQTDLQGMLTCPTSVSLVSARSASATTTAVQPTSLTKGIDRVH
jgi:hypothetical protein